MTNYITKIDDIKRMAKTGGQNGAVQLPKLKQGDCLYIFYSKGESDIPIEMLPFLTGGAGSIKLFEINKGLGISEECLIAYNIGTLKGLGTPIKAVSYDKSINTICAITAGTPAGGQKRTVKKEPEKESEDAQKDPVEKKPENIQEKPGKNKGENFHEFMNAPEPADKPAVPKQKRSMEAETKQETIKEDKGDIENEEFEKAFSELTELLSSFQEGPYILSKDTARLLEAARREKEEGADFYKLLKRELRSRYFALMMDKISDSEKQRIKDTCMKVLDHDEIKNYNNT